MSGVKGIEGFAAAEDLDHAPEPKAAPSVTPVRRSLLRRWLVQDSPYIAMLLLALLGVFFHLDAGYWAILTPLFGVICIIAGWSHFITRQARTLLVVTQVLSWSALILTIYILNIDIVQGVLTTTATSLAMLTLLALGTFMAGLQARVWRICAVGAILLVLVPGLGWITQSVMAVALTILGIVVIGFITWWLGQRRQPAVTTPR